MKKQPIIPTDLRGEKLTEWMEHNSDSQNDETYFRPFDQSELDDARRQHTDLSLKLEDKKKEFAEIKKEFSETFKTISGDITDTLKSVRSRGIEEKGRCYMFRDYETMMVTTYNRFGSIINQRSMTPEEKQLQIDSQPTMRRIASGE